MKILLVVHGYPPEKFGGTETYTRWLAHALVRRGHTVGVFTRTASLGEEFEMTTRCDGEVTVWTVRNTYSKYDDYEMHYANPHIERVFKSAIGEFKPDVVHFTYLLGGLSAGCLFVAKAAGIKTVVTLTDFHHLCAWGQLLTPDGATCPGPDFGIRCAICFAGEDPYAGIPKWKRFFLDLLPAERRVEKLKSPGAKRMSARLKYLRNTLNSADVVIFPTEALGEPYRQWGVKGRKLPFGIDYNLFKDFTRKPSDKVRLAFIGQLRIHKGLHVLTEALRKMTDLDNWVLDVYASANAEEEKRYFAEANRGLEGQLRFRGNFPPDEICRVYEETDVLVTPSLWTENSPLVILFAMRTQTTLVSAEVAGIKEVVGDWGYYYPPNDSSALERLLRRVIAVPAMRNRPGAPHAPDMDENAALVEKIYTEITR